VVVFLAALFMSLGLINLNFGRDWLHGQTLRLAIGVPILLVYAYFEMPALVFPQAFTLLLLTLVPNAAYSSLLAARTAIASRRVVSIRRTPFRPYLVPVAVVFAFAGILVIAVRRRERSARPRRRQRSERVAAERRHQTRARGA
jgi:hypothetical protein